MDRREFLYGLNTSLGSIALTAMLSEETTAQDDVVKVAHFPKAKAKHCIFLFMEGGPSHIDTFDPKPKLKELEIFGYALSKSSIDVRNENVSTC